MKPEISIIVPVYNVEDYLGRCLDSILNQSFKDIEIIVVNDGSTDNSGIICDNYSKKNSIIKVIHKKNGGLSSARNRGLEVAQGKYIGFVDSDDWIDKYMYEKLYNLCEDRNADIGICNFFRNESNRNVDDEVITELNNINGIRELFKGNLYRFSACNKLFKKSCFTNITFPEGRVHEDLSTTYKVFANADKVVHTKYRGYFYFIRENSILTSKYNEKRLDVFIGWTEIIDFISKEYSEVENQVIACFSYACVDNMYYILNQVEEKGSKKRLLSVVQSYVRKNYNLIQRNSILSLKYKLILLILNYNISVVLIVNNIKKRKLYE